MEFLEAFNAEMYLLLIVVATAFTDILGLPTVLVFPSSELVVLFTGPALQAVSHLLGEMVVNHALQLLA